MILVAVTNINHHLNNKTKCLIDTIAFNMHYSWNCGLIDGHSLSDSHTPNMEMLLLNNSVAFRCDCISRFWV